MNKAKRIVVFTTIAVIFLCGIVYAATSLNANNSFSTGVVDIELKEYHKQSGTEAAWSGTATVMPGEKVSLIPRIHNRGADCYVRAKITFKDTDEVNENHITGFDKQWFKADDGYYYYRGILKSQKSLDVFQALDIPEDIPTTMAKQTFTMDIQVHAIQSQNFTPDYNMAAPWGSIEIIQQTKDFTAFEDKEGRAFDIICLEDSKKLLKNEEELFLNVPYLMPGDTFSDTLEFNNKTRRDIKLYFRSVAMSASDLPEKVDLKISMVMGGKQTTIYDGKLTSEIFDKDFLLTTIPAGAEGEFILTFKVPASLTNQYSLIDSDIQWIFSTEPIEDKVIEENAADTGDHNNAALYAAVALLAAAALALLYIFRRKEDSDRELA